MTGRKGRVVSKDDGYVQYESRSEYDIPLEILNLTEKKRFMDGDKVGEISTERGGKKYKRSIVWVA